MIGQEKGWGKIKKILIQLILLCHIKKTIFIRYCIENTEIMWYMILYEKKKSMGHRDYNPQPTGTIKNFRKEFIMPSAPSAGQREILRIFITDSPIISIAALETSATELSNILKASPNLEKGIWNVWPR